MTPALGRFDTFTILVFGAISYVVSAAVVALIGATVFIWLRRIDLVRWWSAVIVGFCGGVAVAVILRLPTLVSVHDTVLLGIEGAGSGFVFWLIWKQGRTSPSAASDDIRHGN